MQMPESEYDHYVREHEAIFGHRPVPGNGVLCAHPAHDEARSLIDGPGVDLDVRFDPHRVLSDDDPAVRAAEARYDAQVDTYRHRIAEMDMEDEALRITRCSVGEHDVRRRGRVLYCRRKGCGWVRAL